MRFTNAALAIALASTLAMPARAEPAEPPISNPAQIVDTLTTADVTALLTELGAQKIQVLEDTAKSKRVVFFDGDVPYNVGIDLCDVRPGKCIAMVLLIIADGGSAYPYEAINKANEDNLFVTAVKGANGKLAFARVNLIDGGVTKKNLAINIGSFALTFRQVLTALQTNVVASANTPNAYLSSTRPTHLRPLIATAQDFEALKAALPKNTMSLRRAY